MCFLLVSQVILSKDSLEVVQPFSVIVSNETKDKTVRDSICQNGGNAACWVYCFSTQFSTNGHCDENNNCICNSTLTTKNNEDIEIFIINK